MCKCNEWNEVSFLVDYSFQFHQFSFTDLLCSALILNFLPLQPLAFSSDMSKQCKPFSQKTFMFLSPLLHRYRNRPKMCFFAKKLSVSPSHYTLARSILLSFLLGRHQRRKYERVRYSAFRMSNKYQLLIWRSIFIYTRNQSDCKHCSWKCPSKIFFKFLQVKKKLHGDLKETYLKLGIWLQFSAEQGVGQVGINATSCFFLDGGGGTQKIQGKLQPLA